MNRALALAVTMFVSFAIPMSGQSVRATLVSELNTTITPTPSTPDVFGTIGGRSYFAANDGVHGIEMWSTDGTPAGTRIVRDATPGVLSGTDPTYVIPFGSRIVYMAATPEHGSEPWITDGTDAGTWMLGDLSVGTAWSNINIAPSAALGRIHSYAVVGNRLYFIARTASTGQELWVTDGTPAGTRLVTNAPGTGCPCPLSVAAVGETVYYSDSAALYRLDEAGVPQLLANPGADELIAVNGRLLVRRFDDPASRWTLSSLSPGSTSLVSLGTFNGQRQSFLIRRTFDASALYFAANDGGGAGDELWRSDGTVSGTRRLTDVNPGAGNFAALELAVAGSNVFTWATNGTSRGVYAVNGSTGAAVRLGDDARGTFGPLYAEGDRLFFVWDDGAHGTEVWVSDGTLAGTALVADIRPGSASSITRRPLGPSRVFAADDGVHGLEPWTTDGTAAGTRMVVNLNTDRGNDSEIAGLRNVGGRAMFVARAGTNTSVWVSDGTASGTVAVAPYAAEHLDSSQLEWVAAQDLYYYTQEVVRDFRELELWRSDGTAAGTFRLAGRPIAMTALGRSLFFGATSTEAGREPWITDGTVAGTKMIKDVVPGPNSHGGPTDNPRPRPLMSRGKIYYVGGGSSYQLYVTDGTAEGTKQLGQFTGLQPGRFELSSFAESDGTVFFAMSLPSSGHELWKTDGVNVTRVRAFPGDSAPLTLHGVGQKVMWFYGNTLMVSDGTEAGTRAIGQYPWPINCTIDMEVVSLGDVMVWTVFERTDRFPDVPAVWRSDGTPEGTYMLARLRENDGPSTPTCWNRGIAAIGNHAYFVGIDPTYGTELFVTDGTIAGTHILADIAPGVVSSEPDQITAVGNRLFFTARTPQTGRELWTLEPPPPVPPRRRSSSR